MKKTYLTLLAVLFIAFQLKADFKTDPKKDEGEKTPARKNLIKINLPTLALRTYALEYERAIGKKTALSIGYRFMPKGAIPMQDRINSLIDDAETSNS